MADSSIERYDSCARAASARTRNTRTLHTKKSLYQAEDIIAGIDTSSWIVLTTMSAALAWQPQSAEIQSLSRIQKSIQGGDLVSARAEIEAALSHSPRDPLLFNFLGVVEAQQNHFGAAESNFRKAIQFAPRFTEAYLNLGRLYQEHADEQPARDNAVAVYKAV